jgi:hypothetical protein
MNTTETLTNAQLFLTTKLTTRLTYSSDSEFSNLEISELLSGIITPLESLLRPYSNRENEDIIYLKELNSEIFEETKCPVKQLVTVVNCLIMLLMSGQKPENFNLVHEIAGHITQNLLNQIPL